MAIIYVYSSLIILNSRVIAFICTLFCLALQFL